MSGFSGGFNLYKYVYKCIRKRMLCNDARTTTVLLPYSYHSTTVQLSHYYRTIAVLRPYYDRTTTGLLPSYDCTTTVSLLYY